METEAQKVIECFVQHPTLILERGTLKVLPSPGILDSALRLNPRVLPLSAASLLSEPWLRALSLAGHHRTPVDVCRAGV